MPITNHWWRAHHGISHDSKLGVVALRSKAKPGEVLAVWVVLLDYASQNEEDRGSTCGLAIEQIALMTGFPEDQVSEIIGQLTQRGLIQQDGVLTAWPKRNPKREREDEGSTERVRRFRDKQRHVTPENTDETPCNAQRREEKSRGEEKSQNLSPIDIGGEGKPTSAVSVRQAAEQSQRRPQKVWYDDQHGLWYSDSYWCRKGKADSRKAYEKAVNRFVDRDGANYNQAALSLRAKAVEDRRRFEGTQDWEWRANLHPATWLNQERWTDEVGPEVHKLTPHQERSRQSHNFSELMEQMRNSG